MTSTPTTPAPAILPAIFDRMREGILVTDADLDEPGPRILYANPAFTRMTGYAADELLNRSPRLLQGPASDRAVLDRLRRQLKAGGSFEGETMNYRKDGTPFVMQWYVEPLVEIDGEVSHFVAIQRDVTEEREKSRRQRALEQAVSQLVDSAVLLREDGSVRYVNRAFLKWSGLPPSEIIGASARELPGAPGRHDLLWALRVLRGGAAWRKEYETSRRDEPRRVFVTVSPIRSEEGQREYLAVGRDVTENHRLGVGDLHDRVETLLNSLRHGLDRSRGCLEAALDTLPAIGKSDAVTEVRDRLHTTRDEIGRIDERLRSFRNEWPADRRPT